MEEKFVCQSAMIQIAMIVSLKIEITATIVSEVGQLLEIDAFAKFLNVLLVTAKELEVIAQTVGVNTL